VTAPRAVERADGGITLVVLPVGQAADEWGGFDRDRATALEEFDGRKLLSIVEQEVAAKFKRKAMSDFRYLLKEIEPPGWALGILIALGLLVSGGLQAWFWVNDPFGKDKTTSSRRQTRREG
jgi:hypothetical protein